MVSKEGGEEVVIDLESEDLTYAQARSIRLKIEKDVLQLQNRVRMLQEEETRAKKKISDTRKKTAEIRQRMENNDQNFKQQKLAEQQNKKDEELSKRQYIEKREKEKNDFKIRNERQYQEKFQQVNALKHQKDRSMAQLQKAKSDWRLAAEERYRKIENDKKTGQVK